MAYFTDISDLGRKAHIGHYLSGIAHAGLIGWLLIGPLFEVEPLPFDVTNVTAISEEDFTALIVAATARADLSDGTPPVPEAPEIPQTPPSVDEPLPATNPETPAPVVPEPAAPIPAPLPELAPDPPNRSVPETAGIEDSAPREPALPESEDLAVVLPETSARPAPRPAPRVAPEPIAPPEPDVRIDDRDQDALVPDASQTDPEPVDDREATAQEEATDTIVTEASEAPSGAPERSIRPRGRPNVVPSVAEAPAAEEVTPSRPSNDATAAAVADALAEALGGTADTTPPSASSGAASGAASGVPANVSDGPPLTSGERAALRASVEKCWQVDVGSAAARVTVVVAMQMEESGHVVINSLRMIGSDGGDARAAEVAFQTARRAIIRCQNQNGRNGYDLPADKYDHWREIEMTFNPENVGR